MGETCLHTAMPARVLGFESSSDTVCQPQKSPGQLEQRASLLSALLKGDRPPPASAFMDTSDVYSDDDDDDDDMDVGEAVEDVPEEEELLPSGGSAPVPIPSTSEAFLKAQREALDRFVYAHQIEEMRRQCAAYFARQARLNEAQTIGYTSNIKQHAPVASVEGTTAADLPEPPKKRVQGF
ncbi:hypothetical protein Agub_g2549 [Astrephomene gubernaculifera]|uniref:Uncharacterized protein n=1 Tax=Astrephomene gubernaculifera TaxID=47775 RepID=A0AAD3DJX0_9CHLO|nr:hypothetical protein Agub_g2549 [Astrephomene gubernaculifera]